MPEPAPSFKALPVALAVLGIPFAAAQTMGSYGSVYYSGFCQAYNCKLIAHGPNPWPSGPGSAFDFTGFTYAAQGGVVLEVARVKGGALEGSIMLLRLTFPLKNALAAKQFLLWASGRPQPFSIANCPRVSYASLENPKNYAGKAINRYMKSTYRIEGSSSDTHYWVSCVRDGSRAQVFVAPQGSDSVWFGPIEK